MATSASIQKLDQNSVDELTLSLKVEDRSSLELVIALVGPVGSGVTTTASILESTLTEKFGYAVERIKVSSLIKEFSDEVLENIQDNLPVNERIERYQTVGNKLRKQHGAHYLADRVIEKIAFARQKMKGSLEARTE